MLKYYIRVSTPLNPIKSNSIIQKIIHTNSKLIIHSSVNSTIVHIENKHLLSDKYTGKQVASTNTALAIVAVVRLRRSIVRFRHRLNIHSIESCCPTTAPTWGWLFPIMGGYISRPLITQTLRRPRSLLSTLSFSLTNPNTNTGTRWSHVLGKKNYLSVRAGSSSSGRCCST